MQDRRTKCRSNIGPNIGCLAVLLLVILRTGTAPARADAQEPGGNIVQLPHAARTDSLGDPLPDFALLRMGTKRFRHPSPVVELALSPDEKTVVTVGEYVIAWECKTGKALWRSSADGHGMDHFGAAYGVHAIDFAADGARFYTPGKYNDVIVWDTAHCNARSIPIKGTLPRVVFGQASLPKSIDVTNDGRRLALGSSGGVVVARMDGKVIFQVENKPKAARTLTVVTD